MDLIGCTLGFYNTEEEKTIWQMILNEDEWNNLLLLNAFHLTDLFKGLRSEVHKSNLMNLFAWKLYKAACYIGDV